MSYAEDNANYTDYDEESFDDNASIEEVSEYEETSSEQSNNDASVEVILEENETNGSLTDSVDKLSCEEEDDNDKISYEERDKDLSSSCSIEEDDNTKNEVQKNTKTYEAKLSTTQKDDHEIDESDSEVDNESEVDIADHMVSLAINPVKSPSAPVFSREKKYNHNVNSAYQKYDESGIEFKVTSQTPTSFNSDNHAFHMDIIQQRRTLSNGSLPAQRSRNANRKSLSFSNERMREIERHNQILLKKILTQKPRKDNYLSPKRRTSTSAVNRKKQQRQIDLDNQVLKKKIEAISVRRRHTYYQ